jgi:hypothetical protein
MIMGFSIKSITKPVSKYVGSVSKIAEKAIHNPVGAWTDSIAGGLNAITLGQSGKIFRGMAAARGTANQAEAMSAAQQAEEQARIDALATDAITKYKSGQLTPQQQASIDQAKSVRDAQVKQQMSSLGITGGTAELGMNRESDRMRTSAIDTALDTEFSKAMESLGLEKQAADVIYQMRKEDQMASAQAFASSMQGIGTVVALAALA